MSRKNKGGGKTPKQKSNSTAPRKNKGGEGSVKETEPTPRVVRLEDYLYPADAVPGPRGIPPFKFDSTTKAEIIDGFVKAVQRRRVATSIEMGLIEYWVAEIEQVIAWERFQRIGKKTLEDFRNSLKVLGNKARNLNEFIEKLHPRPKGILSETIHNSFEPPLNLSEICETINQLANSAEAALKHDVFHGEKGEGRPLDPARDSICSAVRMAFIRLDLRSSAAKEGPFVKILEYCLSAAFGGKGEGAQRLATEHFRRFNMDDNPHKK